MKVFQFFVNQNSFVFFRTKIICTFCIFLRISVLILELISARLHTATAKVMLIVTPVIADCHAVANRLDVTRSLGWDDYTIQCRDIVTLT